MSDKPDPAGASPAPPRGKPAYAPGEKDRRVVEAMAGWAMPQERIAKVLADRRQDAQEALPG